MVRAKNFIQTPGMQVRGNYHQHCSHSFLAILASPEVTATKKKKEGRERRKRGRERGEKFSYTEYLRALQSGILKSHLHLPRNAGNLAVSQLPRDLCFQKPWHFRLGSVSTYLPKLGVGEMAQKSAWFAVFSIGPQGFLRIRLQKGRWEATDAVTLLFLNIFTEIYYNSHAKPVYNSRVFSRFTEVCNYHQQFTYSSA